MAAVVLGAVGALPLPAPVLTPALVQSLENLLALPTYAVQHAGLTAAQGQRQAEMAQLLVNVDARSLRTLQETEAGNQNVQRAVQSASQTAALAVETARGQLSQQLEQHHVLQQQILRQQLQEQMASFAQAVNQQHDAQVPRLTGLITDTVTRQLAAATDRLVQQQELRMNQLMTAITTQITELGRNLGVPVIVPIPQISASPAAPQISRPQSIDLRAYFPPIPEAVAPAPRTPLSSSSSTSSSSGDLLAYHRRRTSTGEASSTITPTTPPTSFLIPSSSSRKVSSATVFT